MSDHPYPEMTTDSRDTLRVLWSNKLLLVLVVAMATGGALYMSSRTSPRYASEARVLVRAVPSGSGASGSVNLNTEAQLMASERVAAVVKKSLDLDQPIGSLLAGLSVTGITGTEVLVVRYVSSDPEVARDLANAFGASYLEFRTDEAISSITSAQDAVQRRLRRLQDQLIDLSIQIDEARDATNDTLAATLDSQRAVLTARIAILQESLDQLRPNLFSDLSFGEVIQEAPLPAQPFSPDHRRNGILGFLAGLALGIGVVMLKERLDDRLRSRIDVQRALGAPVLALVPRFKSRRVDTLPTVISQPGSPAAEAYRALRTGLAFIASKKDIKSVLITSPSAGEGKTATTVNLALAMAQAGKRVIVVSADLRRPRLEAELKARPSPGLANWLLSRGAEPWSLVQDLGIPNLRVVASGQLPPNPAELLASSRLGRLIALLEEQCDVLLFDSPPTLAVADAAIMASHVDGTILVIGPSTRRSELAHARDELRRVGGNLLGAVLNSVDASPHYRSYYSRNSSEQLADDGLSTGRHAKARVG